MVVALDPESLDKIAEGSLRVGRDETPLDDLALCAENRLLPELNGETEFDSSRILGDGVHRSIECADDEEDDEEEEEDDDEEDDDDLDDDIPIPTEIEPPVEQVDDFDEDDFDDEFDDDFEEEYEDDEDAIDDGNAVSSEPDAEEFDD